MNPTRKTNREWWIPYAVIALEDRHLSAFSCRSYGCHHTGSSAADHTYLFLHLFFHLYLRGISLQKIIQCLFIRDKQHVHDLQLQSLRQILQCNSRIDIYRGPVL